MLSNSSRISFFTMEKSIITYDSYSFWANCRANVDLPTRRAPSISTAVLPLRLFFQSSSFSYNFLLNILIIFGYQNYYFGTKIGKIFISSQSFSAKSPIFSQSFSAKSTEFSQSLGKMGRFWRVGVLFVGWRFWGKWVEESADFWGKVLTRGCRCCNFVEYLVLLPCYALSLTAFGL